MKKQLRRKLAVIMAAAIALSAAGCGKSDKAAEEPVREEIQAEQEQAEETKAKKENDKAQEAAERYWFSGKSADDILA